MMKYGRTLWLSLLLLMLTVVTSWGATGTVDSFSPSASAFAAAGGSGTINAISSAPWLASTDDSWISITSTSSFNGDGSITFDVSSNATGFDRTGAIYLGDQTFLVRQAKGAFSDNADPSSWSQESINAIFAAGITLGCGGNNFCKAEPVTRQQMAAFIVRSVVGEDFSFTQEPYFQDIPGTSAYFKYVQKLKDLGLTASEGTYNGATDVTREQMATFLVRAKFGDDFPYPSTPYFSDVPESAWSFKYAQKLKEQGYTTSTGSYGAADPVTREQMAAFLARVFLGMRSSSAPPAGARNAFAGSYDGTAVAATETGDVPQASLTFRIDATGALAGTVTDVDDNAKHAVGGNVNFVTGAVIASFTSTTGKTITMTGTVTGGTWNNGAGGGGTWSAVRNGGVAGADFAAAVGTYNCVSDTGTAFTLTVDALGNVTGVKTSGQGGTPFTGILVPGTASGTFTITLHPEATVTLIGTLDTATKVFSGTWKENTGASGTWSSAAPAPGTYSNATLNGPWLLLPTAGEHAVFFIGDGNGAITASGIFNPGTPAGSYSVQSNGQYSLTLNSTHDGAIPFTGTLTSASQGSIVATGVAVTGTIVKVPDLGACQGTWTGSFVDSASHQVSLTVDATGTITSATGFTGTVSGKLFSATGHAVAYFTTGATDGYNQVVVDGTLSGNTISGSLHLETGHGADPDGTVTLTKQ